MSATYIWAVSLIVSSTSPGSVFSMYPSKSDDRRFCTGRFIIEKPSFVADSVRRDVYHVIFMLTRLTFGRKTCRIAPPPPLRSSQSRSGRPWTELHSHLSLQQLLARRRFPYSNQYLSRLFIKMRNRGAFDMHVRGLVCGQQRYCSS